jgi:uncharacterized protein
MQTETSPQTNPLIEEIFFEADGLRLAGTLHLPQTETKPPVVIGLHGLLSNRSSAKQTDLALACNQLGIAYFRIDHRGRGESQGHFETVTSLEARVQDLLAAVETMGKRNDLSPCFGLFGSSLGGTVSLVGFSRINAVVCVTLAAPIRSIDLHQATKDNPSSGIPESFFKGNVQFDISGEVHKVRNLLVFHGDHDEVVPVDHARQIIEKAGPPKGLVIHPNGDHRMTDPNHQKQFLAEASHWFKRGFEGAQNDRTG